MKYIIINTITKESDTIYSSDSMSAKKFICRLHGWDTRECSVRAVTDR